MKGFPMIESFGDDAALGVYEIVEGFAIAVLGFFEGPFVSQTNFPYPISLYGKQESPCAIFWFEWECWSYSMGRY
jgi:hypothetical protein